MIRRPILNIKAQTRLNSNFLKILNVSGTPPKEVMKQMAVLCENVAEGNLVEVKQMIEQKNIDPK